MMTFLGELIWTGPLPFWQILSKQLVVEGFLCWRWLSEWPEAIRKMKEYIDQVRLKKNNMAKQKLQDTNGYYITFHTLRQSEYL